MLICCLVTAIDFHSSSRSFCTGKMFYYSAISLVCLAYTLSQFRKSHFTIIRKPTLLFHLYQFMHGASGVDKTCSACVFSCCSQSALIRHKVSKSFSCYDLLNHCWHIFNSKNNSKNVILL